MFGGIPDGLYQLHNAMVEAIHYFENSLNIEDYCWRVLRQRLASQGCWSRDRLEGR